jgi:hypothetical protein
MALDLGTEAVKRRAGDSKVAASAAMFVSVASSNQWVPWRKRWRNAEA